MTKEQENKKILKGEEQGNIESPPDPKTVSNATRVDEWVDADGTRHTAADRNKQQRKNTNQNGSNIDEDVDELPPSSDQPEEIAAKEKEQEAQKVDTGKKIATDGGQKDTSHATIGKDEEKKASQDNKKKSDNKKSDSDSQNRNTQTSTQKASNDKIETQTTTTTKKKD